MATQHSRIKLVLEDGSLFSGYAFGSERSVSGEVVFTTGMVGGRGFIGIAAMVIGNYSPVGALGAEFAQIALHHHVDIAQQHHMIAQLFFYMIGAGAVDLDIG